MIKIYRIDIYQILIIVFLIVIFFTGHFEKKIRCNRNPSNLDRIIVKYRSHVLAIILLVHSYKDGFNIITLLCCLYAPYLLIKSDLYVANLMSENKKKDQKHSSE